jgi:hypothetical protein
MDRRRWKDEHDERRSNGAQNRGAVFDVEFECDSSARGIGKATDNRGNTYRVLVRGI